MLADEELSSWLTQHEPFLYSIAWSWFHRHGYDSSADDVEEAVAEAMYRLWRYRQTYEPRPGAVHPLETWIAVVTRSACYATMRAWIGGAI